MPKHWQQCVGEVVVTRVFLGNFAGDGVRFLSRGFLVPGDHAGQVSQGYRWPFGPCGDPRGAGIGTPEAITSTWSSHREIVFDQGPIPDNWR